MIAIGINRIVTVMFIACFVEICAQRKQNCYLIHLM